MRFALGVMISKTRGRDNSCPTQSIRIPPPSNHHSQRLYVMDVRQVSLRYFPFAPRDLTSAAELQL